MKDDWQGTAGDPVIGQGNDQDTYRDFHQLPARLHDPFFLLPPLPKRKRAERDTHINALAFVCRIGAYKLEGFLGQIVQDPCGILCGRAALPRRNSFHLSQTP